MPVKAKASYATIEKFDSPAADEAELLKKVEEVSEKLKQNPNDLALQKEANDLQAAWMTARRENVGSH